MHFEGKISAGENHRQGTVRIGIQSQRHPFLEVRRYKTNLAHQRRVLIHQAAAASQHDLLLQ